VYIDDTAAEVMLALIGFMEGRILGICKCPLSHLEIRWYYISLATTITFIVLAPDCLFRRLGFKAFQRVLQKKQSRYTLLLAFIREKVHPRLYLYLHIPASTPLQLRARSHRRIGEKLKDVTDPSRSPSFDKMIY
jgi:hypothetical protein